ncbi:MAG TPA: rhodanese-like domain-containing protein [Ottowia sp.]|nr:MAG: sulfurtransferase [Ottowia sp.]HNE59443.1 rhodanese-like domain-containing protein [Ottowia sp.]HNI85487.1 rhodanese-like domain-containing protein [Ottowia sp.]HNJ44623.1 rhodanese-like domain-containing protein [Ottowia sp.]HNK53060.1 rhodanese-like domain-containing protein [Ottowia sp.]
MRRPLRFLLLALAWATASLAAQPLLTPAQVKALATDPVVRLIDVREASAYAMQHLPGALSAPYGRWRTSDANLGLPPTPAELTQLVQELGLTPDTHAILVYTGIDATDFGGAARAYWTLKSLGMRRLSILNGGLTAWKAEGLPVSDQPARAPRSQWQPRLQAQWLATRDDVRASLAQPEVLRVDARPAPYFQGRLAHDNARARGTLPGAVHLDSEVFFELGSAALLDKATLESEAQALNATPGQAIITFCNAGHWSATDWFVLSEVLGQPNVRMYPGSMVDWTRASAPLPMIHEPGRWQQLRYALLTWAHRNLGTPAP